MHRVEGFWSNKSMQPIDNITLNVRRALNFNIEKKPVLLCIFERCFKLYTILRVICIRIHNNATMFPNEILDRLYWLDECFDRFALLFCIVLRVSRIWSQRTFFKYQQIPDCNQIRWHNNNKQQTERYTVNSYTHTQWKQHGRKYLSTLLCAPQLNTHCCYIIVVYTCYKFIVLVLKDPLQ